MNREERLQFQGRYLVSQVPDYVKEGESIVVPRATNLDFLSLEVRDQFDLFPEQRFEFSLFATSINSTTSNTATCSATCSASASASASGASQKKSTPEEEENLVELTSLQQLLEISSSLNAPSCASSSSSSCSPMKLSQSTMSSGRNVKRVVAMDITIKPWNFVFVPLAVTCVEKLSVKIIQQAVSEQQGQLLVAVDKSVPIEEISRRLLEKFLLQNNSGIDTWPEDISLTLYDTDGFQHIESITLCHNEMVVLNVQTKSKEILNCFQQHRNDTGLSPYDSGTHTVHIQPPPPPPPSPPTSHPHTSWILDELRYFFAEMKIDVNDSTLAELQKHGSTVDEIIQYYFNSRGAEIDSPQIPDDDNDTFIIPPEVITRECLVCMDKVPIEQMYIMNCADSHSFCITCLCHQIHVSVNPSEDTTGYIPACPCANVVNGCKHTMTLEEIRQILDMDTNHSISSKRENLERAEKLFFVASCIGAGNICCPQCPSSGNDYGIWFEVPLNMRVNGGCVNCPQCHQGFCCKCKAMPYHFRCDCNEIVSHERYWLEWNATGRSKYQEELSSRDAEYREAVQQARADHELKVREAEERFRATKESEEEMGRKYKMCPSCGTPIEHISGCDSMVCGRDYHGNPTGLGCGHGFAWSRAPNYKPRTGEEQVRAEIEVLEPERAKDIQHLITEGHPKLCDHCHDPIVGPLICCINCPSLELCFRCSSTVSFGNDPTEHNDLHICTVIFDA